MSSGSGLQYEFRDASSPPPSPEDLAHRFYRWVADNSLFSGLVAVGYTRPSPGVQAGLKLAVGERPYAEVTGEPAARALVQVALQTIVELDMQRGGLEGEPIYKVFAGKYLDLINGQPWHPAEFEVPSIVWTLDYGAGAIQGAKGMLSPSSMLEPDGTLTSYYRPHVLGSPLELQIFGQGDVVRRLPGDVYAGPVGEGFHVQFMAELALAQTR